MFFSYYTYMLSYIYVIWIKIHDKYIIQIISIQLNNWKYSLFELNAFSEPLIFDITGKVFYANILHVIFCYKYNMFLQTLRLQYVYSWLNNMVFGKNIWNAIFSSWTDGYMNLAYGFWLRIQIKSVLNL